MKRTDTSTRAVNLFGSGKDGFTGGDPLTAVPPTVLDASWANNVQEEIARVIEAAGLTLDGTYAQLLAALKLLGRPTTQHFVTAGSGTYTTPAGVSWIHVVAVGGGGGGAGGSGNGGGGMVFGSDGGAGGSTSFGTSLITCPGGGGGYAVTGGGNGGAAPTVNSPAVYFKVAAGGFGAAGTSTADVGCNSVGGHGGFSIYGGGGKASYTWNTSSEAGAAATGAGGGGGAGYNAGAACLGGGGGGAGSFADLYINAPSATYSYTVGAGGAGGAGVSAGGYGGAAGGAGASGSIVIVEHYI